MSTLILGREKTRVTDPRFWVTYATLLFGNNGRIRIVHIEKINNYGWKKEAFCKWLLECIKVVSANKEHIGELPDSVI